jgi:hypothetical protein
VEHFAEGSITEIDSTNCSSTPGVKRSAAGLHVCVPDIRVTHGDVFYDPAEVNVVISVIQAGHSVS